MATQTTQHHFDFNIPPPDWLAVRILMAEVEEEIAERRKNLLYRISLWVYAVKLFRRTEEEKIILVDPQPRDRDFHRVLLTGLLAFGESLLMDLRDHDEVDPIHIGLKVEDFRAMVETIRDSYAEWYSDMTQQRKEQILAEVFGGPPSTLAADSAG